MILCSNIRKKDLKKIFFYECSHVMKNRLFITMLSEKAPEKNERNQLSKSWFASEGDTD